MTDMEKCLKNAKIFGVLNVTPDSFSDGGNFFDPTLALKKAFKMRDEGADIIDIGAESTAPHNSPISEKEEWNRLEKVLPLLLEHNFCVSLDSYKAGIWKAFFERGGELVNDVSGLTKDTDEKILLLKKFPKTRVILMFSRDISCADPENIMAEIEYFFTEKIALLEKNGIEKSRIILDPGMGGFLSKTPEISFSVLQQIKSLKKFECTILVGTSRKSFLQAVSGQKISHKRVISSVISSLYALQNGADYVRVHDVSAMKEAIATQEKILSA